MNTIKLNIAIKLDEETKNEIVSISKTLKSKLDSPLVLDGFSQIPHITLYQTAFPLKNLTKIKNQLQKNKFQY